MFVDVEQDRGIIRHLAMLFPYADASGGMDTRMEINTVDGGGPHPI